MKSLQLFIGNYFSEIASQFSRCSCLQIAESLRIIASERLFLSKCHSLCFNILVFRFSSCFQVSRFISCHVFPLPLSFTLVTCFPFHIITNHFPTAYSFLVSLTHCRILTFPSTLTPRKLSLVWPHSPVFYSLVYLLIIVLSLHHSLVLFSQH